MLIKNRRKIQLAFGTIVILAYTSGIISLVQLLVLGLILGVLFGKVFCKWMCPIGFLMESMTKNMPDEALKANMYNYYKLGCPISWIQGVTNKFSIFKVKTDLETCISCGLCDKACYITSLNQSKSFYKEKKENPGEAFNCSKCLECIDVCPVNSIKFTAK